jgi:hypothetical protein
LPVGLPLLAASVAISAWVCGVFRTFLDEFFSLPSDTKTMLRASAEMVFLLLMAAKAVAMDAAFSFFTSVNTETKRVNAWYIESGRLLSLGQNGVAD